MVEGAVAAAVQPGVTPAQMEAAVTKSVTAAAKGQLTASEVQKIVDASVKALPAARAGRDSAHGPGREIGEGIGAQGHQRRRDQQNGPGGGGCCHGRRGLPGARMQAAVTKSVTDAAASQLSAADVKRIIDASLEATEAAVMEATMAAKEAGMLAGEARTLATLSAQRLGPPADNRQGQDEPRASGQEIG